ncbi:helix-turn-helix transcriptional regulator [Sporolactobacillus shoreicorticis]|uniref:Helix-turn-helix domain-containing protein n=1 Tax=Sporolactobacillus shoreicorticis TaxID=1923877 RepID=A0ABW5S7T6_9BACL|nr:helix-turn-helix transcriptional regulator [Sporolactobacillus shoreicorticis]MCO7128238.1 helix-turn-helix transcriptional regulator [Sporolactobacillus shoreicorticis]
MITCNLNVLLAERNMKITELAKMTGISRTTITALAYNKSKGIQFDTMDNICTVLNVRPNDLFNQEQFEYEFKILDSEDNVFSDFKEEFFANDEYEGIVLNTEFKIIFRKRAIKEIIPLNVTLPSKDNKSKPVFIHVERPFDFSQRETYKILKNIPIVFKTEFDNELKETVRSYLYILEQEPFQKIPKENIEKAFIDLL